MNMTESMAKLRSLIQEATTGKCNVTAEGKSCPVHGMEECDGYMEEDIKPAGISDELAAKKIAAKIAGTPGLNMPKIKQYVTKYLSMVGKSSTDVDHLAALVATELETTGVMESKKKTDFPDLDNDGNKKELISKAAKDAKAGKKPAVKKGGMSTKQAAIFGKKKTVKEHSSAINALMIKYGVKKQQGVEEGLENRPAPRRAMSPAFAELVRKYGRGRHAAQGGRGVEEEVAAPVSRRASSGPRKAMSPAFAELMRKYGPGRHKAHGVEEDVHVTVDGPEANDLIARIMALAGQPGAESNMSADSTCDGCGAAHGDCTCDTHVDTCPHCGAGEGECECDGSNSAEMQTAMDGPVFDDITMENSDYDYGHDDVGGEVDTDTYMYKAPVGSQRIVKGTLGDNPLVKESAAAIFNKLKGDYKTYVAEAELARSNASDASPLTANNRNEFEKDPFTDEEPVTDGSRSPLSNVKRQSVNK